MVLVPIGPLPDGLHHCPNLKCVMHFAKRLHDTDVKGYDFCPRCRPLLEELARGRQVSLLAPAPCYWEEMTRGRDV